MIDDCIVTDGVRVPTGARTGASILMRGDDEQPFVIADCR